VAVLARDGPGLERHLSKDFSFQGVPMQGIGQRVATGVKVFQIGTIYISDFDVETLDRERRKATASFRVRVDNPGGDILFFARARTEFVLEGDAWKLRTVAFFSEPGGQPVQVPLP
jgi:hypothetical protein